jgi:hypothetical protein
VRLAPSGWQHEPGAWARGSGTLSDDSIRVLLDQCREAPRSLRNEVVWGLACELWIVRRGGKAQQVKANLAGLTADERQHPAVRLIAHVLDEASEVVPARQHVSFSRGALGSGHGEV